MFRLEGSLFRGVAATRGTAARLLMATCVLGLSAASAPGCGSSEPKIASVCANAGPCQTRLTILHTSDIHSRLIPYDQIITQVDADLGLGVTGDIKNVGGVARMGYILGRERSRADRALHLDSGDCFQGAPIFNFYQGEPEVRSQSALGTDAMVLGNHEFDSGAINVARQMQRWSNFPLLGANYLFNDAKNANTTLIGSVVRPFEVFNREGLKVAVIGMANISTLGSIFDQPNKLGIQPLNTAEVAQFYIDLLRPQVDLIVMLTHLGLQPDQDMVKRTTGIDIVLGGHNHIVINPPQEIKDCSADEQNPGFVWAVDPYATVDPEKPPPNDAQHPDPQFHPYQFKRACHPRNVIIAHSGSFAKYVGRLDVMLTNDPSLVTPTGNPADYDTVNGYEVVSSKYQAFPIDDTVPEDPVIVDMLQPYRRTLDKVADLDILVGFSPGGAKRTAPQGGDSPLGNLVATAMWLRLGVQSDFSLTNTTGIRADLNPGPINIEEMYNIFPFENSISKMQLSGFEIRQMFDFVARRSSGRSCVSQAQIAGARVRLNCAGCSRPDTDHACVTDTDCPVSYSGACDTEKGKCVVAPCAEQVYVGRTTKSCLVDAECAEPNGATLPGQCDKGQLGDTGKCLSPIADTNLYELATSNYLAGGGSGYRVLQRNTTQFDTKIQQRDALIDYLRQGHPCGYAKGADRPDGLKACATDPDCKSEGDFVCACPAHSHEASTNPVACTSEGQCSPTEGRCVRRDCRDKVAEFHDKACASSPYKERAQCKIDLNACALAGEECKLLSCVDATVGNFTDNRLEMLGR